MAVTDFRHRKLHNVNRVNPAGHGDAQQLGNKVGIMLPERGSIIVADVAIIVAEFIQPLERGRVDAKMQTIARNCFDYFATIALVNCIFRCDDLIDAFNLHHQFSTKNSGNRTCCVGL